MIKNKKYSSKGEIFMEEIRLQKFMAEAGVASRRKCEELIRDGKVKVNGKIASIGEKINKDKDIVTIR